MNDQDQELTALSERDALTFFIEYLEDEVVSRVDQTEAETYYVASVLAHHAIVSRGNTEYRTSFLF
jgi:hypothetical protein